MFAQANPDIWRYQPHLEVWIVVAAALGLAYYATRVIAPKIVPAGQPVATRKQKTFFVVAVLALWFSSDWPMHDISEEYLYSAHMFQHLLISFIVPPLFLMAMPEWLARLIVSENGTTGVWIRRLTRPVVAGGLFNFVIALTHLPAVVNSSIESGPTHYFVHLVVFSASTLMWIPVCGPLPELRMTLPAQMVYLFLMSVIPTIPAAWLTFADEALYHVYDHDVRLWGVDIATDQQMAGLIMKLVGGFYLWGIITVLFYKWSKQNAPTNRKMRKVVNGQVVEDAPLLFEDVQAAFDQNTDAPKEMVPGD